MLGLFCHDGPLKTQEIIRLADIHLAAEDVHIDYAPEFDREFSQCTAWLFWPGPSSKSKIETIGDAEGEDSRHDQVLSGLSLVQ